MLEEFFFLCKNILFSFLMTVISDPMFSSSFSFPNNSFLLQRIFLPPDFALSSNL